MTLAGTPTVPSPYLSLRFWLASTYCLASASRSCWNDTAKCGRSCPYAQRTWLTLLELGLPFETRKVDLSNKPKEFVDTYHEVYPDARGTHMLT